MVWNKSLIIKIHKLVLKMCQKCAYQLYAYFILMECCSPFKSTLKIINQIGMMPRKNNRISIFERWIDKNDTQIHVLVSNTDKCISVNSQSSKYNNFFFVNTTITLQCLNKTICEWVSDFNEFSFHFRFPRGQKEKKTFWNDVCTCLNFESECKLRFDVHNDIEKSKCSLAFTICPYGCRNH